MNLVRKYLRGSGRVLAFVFVASVIWLLFDMAALRISLTDVSGQQLKERVIKERELFRKQSRVTQVVRRGFRNPVHVSERPPLNHVKLDQVYRHEEKEKEVKSDKVQGGHVTKSHQVVEVKLNNGDTPHGEVAPKQDSPVSKKAVNLDSKTPGDSKKDTNKTLPAGLNLVDKLDSKINQKDEHVKPGTKLIQPEAVKARLVQTTPAQLPNKDVKEEDNKAVEKQVRVTNQTDLKADKEPPKPTINHPAAGKPHHNTTAVRKSGVHSVLSLDLTQSPRNAKAVGQFGLAAFVPSNENAEVRKRWDEGHFNVHLSDKIPVDRAIPDTRPPKCTENLVHDDLPSTSVIFCFVDEVWSTLLRSVHSVLNRSPPHLLKEIILVDDFSSKDYLKKQLDEYMSQFPKVRIIRLTERQGLIRARLAGAAAAKGDVLTFLDSHIECNVGWLEPLLERIYQDRKKVPCPVIEVISDKDMSYVLVDSFQRGIFKWPLVFGWSPVPQEYIRKHKMTDTDPIRCPVMAGGLFSIDKSYFFELGAYDPGLDVWGGENMEISFKIWMCGGEIEIIPCSRVGHIFRGQNPYKFPKDRQKTVERNLARVAEVWLDEYKDLFYGHGYHHLLDKSVIDIGNLTAQVELRKKLNCNSFKWYLQSVYPDMDAPLVKADGLVYNRGLRKCLALQEGSLSFEICDLGKQSQHFNYTWLRHIQHEDLCVAPQAEGNGIALQKCDKAKHELRWMYKTLAPSKSEHFISETSLQMCLEAKSQGAPVAFSRCDFNSAFQKWQLTHYYAQ